MLENLLWIVVLVLMSILVPAVYGLACWFALVVFDSVRWRIAYDWIECAVILVFLILVAVTRYQQWRNSRQ